MAVVFFSLLFLVAVRGYRYQYLVVAFVVAKGGVKVHATELRRLIEGEEGIEQQY
jgi:hypothetical protein